MTEFRLSPLADDDLTDIWNYVAEYDERSADSLIEQLVHRFVMLSRFQEAGRDRDELIPGLKSFPVDRYLVFYRVIPEGIEILRVLHSSRDVENLLTEETCQKIDDEVEEEGR